MYTENEKGLFDYGNNLVPSGPDGDEKRNKKSNGLQDGIPKRPPYRIETAEPSYDGNWLDAVKWPKDDSPYSKYLGMDGSKRTASPANTDSYIDYAEIARRWSMGEAGTDADENERRKMRDAYSTTERAFNDIAGEYYNNVLLGDFKRKRDETKRKAKKVYKDYISVVGADPQLAAREMQRADDPGKDIDYVMNGIDVQEIRRLAAPVAMYAGYDTDEYVDKFILPTMRNRLVDELVKENVPKSSVEYILRSSLDNSLVGKVSTLANDLALVNNVHSTLSRQGLDSYNAGWGERLASGVGGLLVDTPVFSVLGGLSAGVTGKATSMVTDHIAKKVLVMKGGGAMTHGAARAIAKRAVTGRLSNRIMQSAATQGLTLGTYDMANSVANDLLAGNGVDVGNTAYSFGKGAVTGALIGAVGTPLREMAARQSGVNRVAASVGVLGAESAVFTGVTEADKIAHGIKVEPIDIFLDYGESAATLGIMKVAHWRPKGQKIKLDSKGELKKELQLTDSEKTELRELDIDPDGFMSLVQRELRLPSLNSSGSVSIMDTYSRIMADENVSASTKSKLMFVVENKLSSTLPVIFDYRLGRRNNGRWFIDYYDEFGRKISSETFENSSNANNRMIVQSGMIRSNRIVTFEAELTRGADSQNFLRQAGLYAMEKGVDVDALSEAMYKKATGQRLLPEEDRMIGEILERAAYNDAGMVQYIHDIRRMVEKKHNLDNGSLTLAYNKEFYRISKAENEALIEYEGILRGEVEKLKGGTDRNRARMISEKGKESDSYGMTNDELKQKEVDEYKEYLKARDADRSGQTSGSGGSMSLFHRRIIIPKDDNSGVVWSYKNAGNSKETVEMYRQHAADIGNRLGVKLNLITDERQIKEPEIETPGGNDDYNMKIASYGWTRGGDVYINLPNMTSLELVEKTILHEVVGHRGLLAVFGDNLYPFMEDVYKKASPEVMRGIEETKRKYGFVDNYTLVEEYLAHLAEKTTLTPQERTFYRRVKDYIKNLLIRLHIYSGSNRQVSEAELTDIMQRHCEYIAERRRPSDYRKKVFGDFKAAHAKENTYYNEENYMKGVRKKAYKNKLFPSTPKFFWKDKGRLYYDQLPEKQQRRVREWLDGDRADAEFRRGGERYSLGDKDTELSSNRKEGEVDGNGKKGALSPDWAEKTTIKDPLYRILKVEAPLYAMGYRRIVENPIDEWPGYEYDMWNSLADMASNTNMEFLLGDVVSNAEFFRIYPALRSIPVDIRKSADVPVAYDKKRNTFVIDRRVFADPRMKSDFLSGLEDAAEQYMQYGTAVEKNVVEINKRMVKRYETAMDYAKKIRFAKNFMEGFDADGKISEAFKNDFGFYPEEFLKRFPESDDFFLYKVLGGIGKNYMDDVLPPGNGLIIRNFRRFFAGPYEIIIDAADKGEEHSSGPLSMRKRNVDKSRSQLEQAEADALTRDYLEMGLDENADPNGKLPFWWYYFLEENDERRAIMRMKREERESNRRRGGRDEDLLN